VTMTRKSPFLSLSVVLLTCSVVPGAEPNETAVNLKFQRSSVEIGWSLPPGLSIGTVLEFMFVKEAVSLRAAEARKKEATNLRADAAKLIDLNKTIEKLPAQKEAVAKELRGLPYRLQQANAKFADVNKHQPEVLDNTVFIYPVKD
jgi:hypothetical protein